jgi:hypothetical protein
MVGGLYNLGEFLQGNIGAICDDDERAKAERLLKDTKMRKKWVAKIARAWRKEGKLKPLYIVDALGKGRELVRG